MKTINYTVDIKTSQLGGENIASEDVLIEKELENGKTTEEERYEGDGGESSGDVQENKSKRKTKRY